jgi:hypothetical protein
VTPGPHPFGSRAQATWGKGQAPALPPGVAHDAPGLVPRFAGHVFAGRPATLRARSGPAPGEYDLSIRTDAGSVALRHSGLMHTEQRPGGTNLDVSGRSSAGEGSTGRAVTSGGIAWSTAFTLGPYLALVLVVVAWAWAQDTPSGGPCERFDFGCTLSPRDEALLFAFISAPFAALATGVAWLLVLLLQLSPAKRWTGASQGAIAAGVVLVAATSALVAQTLR